MLSYGGFERVPKINVFCRDNNWLFDDLKREIAKQGAIHSRKPLPDADAWICVRSSEADLVPSPKRCLIQIHDVKNKVPKGFGQYSYVHDYQRRQSGIDGFVLPIGSRDIDYDDLPEKPTIGFFCKEYGQLKRSNMFAEAVMMAKAECDFNVLMIGDKLEHIRSIGRYEVRGAGVNDYKRIDALVTCSISPMIPISCYEALAAGRSVISTPREWPFESNMIKEGETVDDIAELIYDTVKERMQYKPFMPYSRSDWAKRQIEEALKLCK